jgi:hypothetical protein
MYGASRSVATWLVEVVQAIARNERRLGHRARAPTHAQLHDKSPLRAGKALACGAHGGEVPRSRGANTPRLPGVDFGRARPGCRSKRWFKTLVVETNDRGRLFAAIPAAYELDLKSLSKPSGRRKVTLVPLARVQPPTGYVRGGTTVLAARKAFPAFLDERAF